MNLVQHVFLYLDLIFDVCGDLLKLDRKSLKLSVHQVVGSDRSSVMHCQTHRSKIMNTNKN